MSVRSIDDITTTRLKAQRVRARALIDLAEGRRTLMDVISAAVKDDGSELLHVPLAQLLMTHPKIGDASARRTINQMERNLGTTIPRGRTLTIRWLIDGRSRGCRMVAFADAVFSTCPTLSFGTERHALGMPFTGFPYFSPPTQRTLASYLERP